MGGDRRLLLRVPRPVASHSARCLSPPASGPGLQAGKDMLFLRICESFIHFNASQTGMEGTTGEATGQPLEGATARLELQLPPLHTGSPGVI